MRKVKSFKISLPLGSSGKTLAIYKQLMVSELVQDFLKIFLRNPYLKRPHLIFSYDFLRLVLDRTWFVFEKEIEEVISASTKITTVFNETKASPINQGKIIVNEKYGSVQEIHILDEILKVYEVEFTGNEARKHSREELKTLLRESLQSQGALFEVNSVYITEKESKTFSIPRYIFIPISKDLEFK